MTYSQQYGTTELRDHWNTYECKQGGKWADPSFFGQKIGGVPEVMTDAYKALETALRARGYEPPDRAQSVWAYNCRMIASSGKPSLHSYGIAVDIDPAHNPQADVPPYSGWFTEPQIDAVMAIKNTAGKRIWWWGGFWSGVTLPDLMHFQVDQPPSGVTVDWNTVPGSSTGDDDLAHLSNEAQKYWQAIYESLEKDPDKPNKGDTNPPGAKLFSYLASVWRWSVKETGKTTPEGIVNSYLKDK